MTFEFSEFFRISENSKNSNEIATIFLLSQKKSRNGKKIQKIQKKKIPAAPKKM